MILLAYRHGLRVSELTGLRREQMDLRPGAAPRSPSAKTDLPSTHPLPARGRNYALSRKVFPRPIPKRLRFCISERRAPADRRDLPRKLIARAGDAARLGMPIHTHMLRHSTGFKLANDGQDTRAIQHYLGHRNIQYTTIYTQLAPNRFNDFWKD